MKIKVKKQMTLPQLIQWGWSNLEQVENKVFQSDKMDSLGEYTEVHFSIDGHGFYTNGVTDIDTFTVEVEEEITEETEILRLLEVYKYNSGSLDSNLRHECSVKECVGDNERCNIKNLAIYMLNDDASMTLLWKDGEMVE